MAGNKNTVVVGMSGGVDSSLSALLLKEQGHDVVGLFMRNWEDQGECNAEKDFDDVARVCEQIGIKYYSVDFVQEYWESVFEHFLGLYRAGHTPNPDVLCNKEIKFKAFFDYAMDLGADYLATGHYCQVSQSNQTWQLLKGRDPGKDQSYFLHAIDGKVLSKVLFPIGHLTKAQVRELAKKHHLATSHKKDSTGICFIGERKFAPFLQEYLRVNPGEFRQLDGTVVGQHSGVAFYTIGQRKGLGLGGPGEPWYVIKKDREKNIVYVERGEHSALYTSQLIASDPTWIAGDQQLPLRCQAKVRYRQEDQACEVYRRGELLEVKFAHPQRAVTTGQYIVFYQGSVCLGGALIAQVGDQSLLS